MTIKVAINGFGRIGRLVYRVFRERKGYEVVAINDLADSTALAHLLKYDSVHGRYPGSITGSEGKITVDGTVTRTIAEKDPARLPWGKMGVDIVVESTGIFRTQELCLKHVEAGAKKVVLTVPPKGDMDAMVVIGVNDDVLEAGHRVVSAASCTTNCLAPVARVLHDRFGIEHGLMVTIHAYTNDQRIADQIHKDLRRARAGAQNIIPTTTGAARAVGKVIPDLNGKLDGYALRVPVPDGSAVDLTAVVSKKTSVEEINAALREAAEGPLKGVLEYTEDPIVSSDIIGNPHSSILDGKSTMASGGGKLIKTVSWYDNEMGYSHRVVDMVQRLHDLGYGG